jgi:pimeloyl-ACP methyl ester carboxylesterase
MKAVITIIFYLVTASLVASCVLQRPQSWDPDERSGLGVTDSRLDILADIVPDKNKKLSVKIRGKMIEKMISVPIGPTETPGLSIDLYYLVRMPSSGRAKKTVLFCQGGPGQFTPGPVVLVTIADFLTDNGYNVVFYHARGAGFSQMLPANQYDRFLKTSYVVKDIEAIRLDLIREGFLGPNGKWDAVIGYSHGTVVAQQYAGTYKNNLERLILIGVQSRHGFQSSPDSFNQITRKIRDINRTTLKEIFKRKEFSNLSVGDKDKIVDWAFGVDGISGIFQKAEEKFGSLGFITSAYCEIKARNELADNNLDYSQQFFRALRRLREFGWAPPLTVQVDIGKTIENEYFGRASGGSDCGPDPTGSSDRVFNVVNIYDGINFRFLDKWLANGKTKVRDALKASAGEVHYVKGNINKYVSKVGITDSENIEPWEPARYKHDKPTFVLTGTADTVPVGDAVEHIFRNALSGARILIEYPGVGHRYALPRIPAISKAKPDPCNCTPEEDPPVCSPGTWILDCLIYSFLEMSPATFSNPNDNRILPVIMKDNASICYQDQNMALARPISGTCP